MDLWCTCAASSKPICAYFDVEISDSHVGHCLGVTKGSDPRDCLMQQITTCACLSHLVFLVQNSDSNGVVELQGTELNHAALPVLACAAPIRRLCSDTRQTGDAFVSPPRKATKPIFLWHVQRPLVNRAVVL